MQRSGTDADAVKVPMVGADMAMMTSALLRHGPEHLRVVEAGLRDWLEEPACSRSLICCAAWWPALDP